MDGISKLALAVLGLLLLAAVVYRFWISENETPVLDRGRLEALR